ncbi:MAG TPA: DUF1153 domain-containing protein [Rhizomicrobium sp.]|nr:DUF1153 domain-containing protein [Rhizomicrobium sp.]
MTNPATGSSKALRWVARRKAEVIDAIRKGEMSFAEACEQYNLSADELFSWQTAYKQHGLGGLRAMRVQICRHSA